MTALMGRLLAIGSATLAIGLGCANPPEPSREAAEPVRVTLVADPPRINPGEPLSLWLEVAAVSTVTVHVVLDEPRAIVTGPDELRVVVGFVSPVGALRRRQQMQFDYWLPPQTRSLRPGERWRTKLVVAIPTHEWTGFDEDGEHEGLPVITKWLRQPA